VVTAETSDGWGPPPNRTPPALQTSPAAGRQPVLPRLRQGRLPPVQLSRGGGPWLTRPAPIAPRQPAPWPGDSSTDPPRPNNRPIPKLELRPSPVFPHPPLLPINAVFTCGPCSGHPPPPLAGPPSPGPSWRRAADLRPHPSAAARPTLHCERAPRLLPWPQRPPPAFPGVLAGVPGLAAEQFLADRSLVRTALSIPSRSLSAAQRLATTPAPPSGKWQPRTASLPPPVASVGQLHPAGSPSLRPGSLLLRRPHLAESLWADLQATCVLRGAKAPSSTATLPAARGRRIWEASPRPCPPAAAGKLGSDRPLPVVVQPRPRPGTRSPP